MKETSERYDDDDNSTPNSFDYENISINDIGLSARSLFALRGAGIHTIKEMMELSYEQLQQINNLGKMSVTEVIKAQNEVYKSLLAVHDNCDTDDSIDNNLKESIEQLSNEVIDIINSNSDDDTPDNVNDITVVNNSMLMNKKEKLEHEIVNLQRYIEEQEIYLEKYKSSLYKSNTKKVFWKVLLIISIINSIFWIIGTFVLLFYLVLSIPSVFLTILLIRKNRKIKQINNSYENVRIALQTSKKDLIHLKKEFDVLEEINTIKAVNDVEYNLFTNTYDVPLNTNSKLDTEYNKYLNSKKSIINNENRKRYNSPDSSSSNTINNSNTYSKPSFSGDYGNKYKGRTIIGIINQHGTYGLYVGKQNIRTFLNISSKIDIDNTSFHLNNKTTTKKTSWISGAEFKTIYDRK